MKKIFYAVIPFSIALSGCASMMTTTIEYNPGQSSNANYDPPPPVYNNQGSYNYDNSPQTDQVFYDELSPYGTWIDYPEYGYVWSPDAGSDFTPYASNGYWVYSDYGWTWVSNYHWGWAAFHYGRWFYDDNNGWLWVPGHEWAPAWVTWASYGDYYCWAPLAPRVDPRYVSSRGGWAPPANSWSVVPARRLTQPNVTSYIVKTNATVIHNITVINNVTYNYNTNQRGRDGNGRQDNGPVTYNRGPRVNEVENYTNTRVQSVKVSDNTRPGAQTISNNQLLVYRPVIKTNQQQGNSQPAPHRVGALRPMNDPNRNNPNQQNTQPGNNQNQPGNQQNPGQRGGRDNGQRPNNPPQYQQNQRPDQQQQQNSRPDRNANPQQSPNQAPNNQQQQQNGRPGGTPNQQQNPDQRPNNQQQQQNMRPGSNQNSNQQQNSDQRPNNNQQQNNRPTGNQSQQNPDQRSNQQQNNRPGSNQNSNQQPGNQQQVQPGRNNFWQMKPKQLPKPDTTKRRVQKVM